MVIGQESEITVKRVSEVNNLSPLLKRLLSYTGHCTIYALVVALLRRQPTMMGKGGKGECKIIVQCVYMYILSIRQIATASKTTACTCSKYCLNVQWHLGWTRLGHNAFKQLTRLLLGILFPMEKASLSVPVQYLGALAAFPSSFMDFLPETKGSQVTDLQTSIQFTITHILIQSCIAWGQVQLDSPDWVLGVSTISPLDGSLSVPSPDCWVLEALVATLLVDVSLSVLKLHVGCFAAFPLLEVSVWVPATKWLNLAVW